MKPIKTYIDEATGVLVKVFPPKKRKEKTITHCNGLVICRTPYKEVSDDKVANHSMSYRARENIRE